MDRYPWWVLVCRDIGDAHANDCFKPDIPIISCIWGGQQCVSTSY